MNVTWLGQAGLYFETAELRILIDPYFSDSVAERNASKHRRMPLDDCFFTLPVDVLLFTHDHIDHYDPQTVDRLLRREEPVSVLAPESCFSLAAAHGGAHTYVPFDRGTQYQQGNVLFTAVHATHSDPAAIGVVIDADGKRVYVTGDTLYDAENLNDLPDGIDAVFLPINGTGNNMNAAEAARFAAECGAKTAVPIHGGMFDGIDPQSFPFERKIIPQFCKKITI